MRNGNAKSEEKVQAKENKEIIEKDKSEQEKRDQRRRNPVSYFILPFPNASLSLSLSVSLSISVSWTLK